MPEYFKVEKMRLMREEIAQLKRGELRESSYLTPEEELIIEEKLKEIAKRKKEAEERERKMKRKNF
jgi:hypothetical protein